MIALHGRDWGTAAEVAQIARDKRLSTRGRPRRLDMMATTSA